MAPPPGNATSTIAPWDVNDTTSPSMVLPTGKAATKLMKVSGSFTAGGGVGRGSLFPPPGRPGRRAGSLPTAPFGGGSFLALARFSGATFLAAALFFAAPRDFSGAGGCRASLTDSSIALQHPGLTL